MDKNRVNSYLPHALHVIKKLKIADEDGNIISTYRSNISGFGASVAMGSFKSAIAFYSVDAKSENQAEKNRVLRSQLIRAMYSVVNYDNYKEELEDHHFNPDKCTIPTVQDICRKILEEDDENTYQIRDAFLDASIALKLAMNAFNLVKPSTMDNN